MKEGAQYKIITSISCMKIISDSFFMIKKNGKIVFFYFRVFLYFSFKNINFKYFDVRILKKIARK